MRRLSAVLLALPLRKDFHPLWGKVARSAFKIIPHKKAAAQNPVQQPYIFYVYNRSDAELHGAEGGIDAQQCNALRAA